MKAFKERFGHYVEVFEELPNGWREMHGTTTQPKGYYWANNGKSFFSERKEYRQALIKK